MMKHATIARLYGKIASVAAAMILLVPVGARAADAGYSPVDLYDAGHRRLIDSGCTEARAAAETLNKPDAVVTADQAVDFQRAFVACANRKMLNPDMDKLRYLSLAAAGAAYVESNLTSGPRRDAALTRGYTWSDNLSATSGGSQLVVQLNRPIDNGSGAKAVPTLGITSGGGANNSDGGGGGSTERYLTSRNPFGGNTNWLFGSDAAKLRDAFTEILKVRTIQQQSAK